MRIEVEAPFGGLFIANVIDRNKLTKGLIKYYPEHEDFKDAVKEYARSWIELYTLSCERFILGSEIKLIPRRTPLPEFLGLYSES